MQESPTSLSTDEGNAETNLNVDKMFWFEDGNVVLVAENTLFRVHRSVLSKHSEVFRGMFALPNPTATSDGANMIDGCPIVHLPDSRKDIVCLLNALYEGQELFNSNKTLTVFDVSRMLKVGTKYFIEPLREEAIRRLAKCFPPTLERFRKGISINIVDDDHDVSLHRDLSIFRPQTIHIINTARVFDLHFLLPPVFYICAQLSFDQLVDGVPDDDGTICRLSTDDLKNCLRGREALLGADVRHVKPLFFPVPSDLCVTKEACDDCKRTILQTFWWQDVANHNPLMHISHWLEATIAELAGDKRLCESCLNDFQEQYEGYQEDTWNALGEYFSVSPWPIKGSENI